jgi:hypothetical protein
MTRTPQPEQTEKESAPELTALRWFPAAVRYTGLAIAIYETLVEHVDRPALLGLAGSMMLGSIALEVYTEARRK